MHLILKRDCGLKLKYIHPHILEKLIFFKQTNFDSNTPRLLSSARSLAIQVSIICKFQQLAVRRFSVPQNIYLAIQTDTTPHARGVITHLCIKPELKFPSHYNDIVSMSPCPQTTLFFLHVLWDCYSQLLSLNSLIIIV